MRILKSCAVALAISTLPHGASMATSAQHEEAVQHWGQIDMQGLEELVNGKVPFSLVDARSDKWFDGTLIAGARRLPADASKETIEKTLPSKTELVVVYCGGEQCPASKTLAQRLADYGYKNIMDYHGGISEWKAQNKPIQKLDI